MELHIDHLVIITGPTSSGKSTLIKSVASGKLDADIGSIFPGEISNLPSVPAMKYITKEYLESLNVTPGKPIPGMVLHYDFLRPYKKMLKSYHEDNIDYLINRANRVTVYILKPDPEALLAQLTRGELNGKELESEPAGMQLRKKLTRSFNMIPIGFRKVLKRLIFFNRKSSVTNFNKLLYFKYQDPEWVEQWYGYFNTYLEEKAKDGKQVDRHYIKPAQGSTPTWKVIS